MKSQYIGKEEFKCMLKDVKEPYKLVMLVSLETGLRLSDVLNLTYRQAYGWEQIKERKTGKACTIDLPDYLRAALMDLQLRSSSGNSALVFPSEKAIDRPIHRSTIYRAVKRAAEGYEVNVTPHTARKIFAVEALKACGDLKKVQAMLRHDRLDTTLLYAFSDVLQHFSD